MCIVSPITKINILVGFRVYAGLELIFFSKFSVTLLLLYVLSLSFRTAPVSV